MTQYPLEFVVFDVENTVKHFDDGSMDLSPHHPDNKLVMCATVQGELTKADGKFQMPDATSVGHAVFNHKHRDNVVSEIGEITTIKSVNKNIEHSKLVIGHNLKHDFMWALATGIHITDTSKIYYDTMLAEYLLAKGRVAPSFSLDAVAKRRKCGQKDDAMEQYYASKTPIDEVPLEVLIPYAIKDVEVTFEVFKSQLRDLNEESEKFQRVFWDMMEHFKFVSNIEWNGLKIDTKYLTGLKETTKKEIAELADIIQAIVPRLVGDTPINVNSNDNLNTLLFGRIPNDKRTWASVFNIGTEMKGSVRKKKYPKPMSPKIFRMQVRDYSTAVYKTVRGICKKCNGEGRIRLLKKNGEPGMPRTCPTCVGMGVVQIPTAERAGAGLANLVDYKMVSASGFSTSGGNLDMLLARYKNKYPDRGEDDTVQLVLAIRKKSQLESYLSMTVDGIFNGLRVGDLIHPSFNQAITATGRLSSSKPNFQNLPRGDTFPIRRAIISRFPGGKILDVDWRQLEYRTAVELGHDYTGLHDILNGVDAHAFTAAQIYGTRPADTDFKLRRQDAKPDTFKPLYGGTQGTEDQMRYYKAFMEKHEGIAAWHEALASTALSSGVIVLPSGREYDFSHVERYARGGVSFFTQLKNYPVQGLATADIVPLGNYMLWYERVVNRPHLKSLFISNVHDNDIIDVYPGEEEEIIEMVHTTLCRILDEIKKRWGYTWVVPLGIEIKIGLNGLDQDEVGEWYTPHHDDHAYILKLAKEQWND